MTLVKPKAETREAWQYTTRNWIHCPAWVLATVEMADGTLSLIRRSGKQIVNLGDWLIRNLDGDPDWLTHDQMRKTFDEVVP